MAIKTLVMWDWDGTIVNSRAAITLALDDLAAHYKQEPVTPAEVANVMSFHLGAFWIRRFAERMDEAYDYFLERFRGYSKQIILFPDITPCLDYLKNVGVMQIVASNCTESVLKKECENVGLIDYFERVCGTEVTNDIKKPSVDYGKKSLDGLVYDRLIMIGDGTSDMLFARNMGALAIYVQDKAMRDLSVPFDIYCPDRTTLLKTLQKTFPEAK